MRSRLRGSLAFDEASAYAYGEVMSRRKRAGRPMSILDGQIAAIAFTHALSVVTRNVRDFTDCGLNIFDPF